MEVNLMNVLKEEGPSVHLAVGKNLPYGHGGLHRSGASPYFLELFDVKHLLIRIGRYQNVITREEVQTGTDGDQ